MSTKNQNWSEGESESVSVTHGHSTGQSRSHGRGTTHSSTHSVSTSRTIQGDSTSPGEDAAETPGGSRETSVHHSESHGESSGSSETTKH